MMDRFLLSGRENDANWVYTRLARHEPQTVRSVSDATADKRVQGINVANSISSVEAVNGDPEGKHHKCIDSA